MRSFARTFALAGALVLTAAPAALAAPSADEQKATKLVLNDYVQDGRIDACDYTVEELEAAIAGVTADLRQYASDFPAALRDALAARARGACDAPEPTPTPAAAATTAPPATGGGAAPPAPKASAEPTPPPTRRVVPDPPAPALVASVPQAPAPDPGLERAAATAPANNAPVPLIGLGVLSALALLSVMMLGTLKRLGEGGGRLAPAYHSWREAQWRAGGVWEDFRDWLRFGR